MGRRVLDEADPLLGGEQRLALAHGGVDDGDDQLVEHPRGAGDDVDVAVRDRVVRTGTDGDARVRGHRCESVCRRSGVRRGGAGRALAAPVCRSRPRPPPRAPARRGGPPTAGGARRSASRYGGSRKTRSYWAPLCDACAEEAQGVGLAHARHCAESACRLALMAVIAAAVVVDEGDVRGAARERFEAERAASRRTDRARARRGSASPRIENSASRTRSEVGRVLVARRGLEGPASVGAGDHAHQRSRLGCRAMDPLAAVPVSTLCDVDKSLPVVDPAIRPLTDARGCAARPTPSWPRASSSPCCRRSARRRRATCSSSRPAARRWPRWASCWRPRRGAAAWAGSSSTATCATAPGCRRICRCGRAGRCRWRAAATSRRASAGRSCAAACASTPGDLVLADDDGIVIAPRAQLEACARAGATRSSASRPTVLGEVRVGASLIGMTNLPSTSRALRAGEPSSLAITPPS